MRRYFVRALPIPHPFCLSLSKALHGLCPGFDGLSPNGGWWRMVWRARPIPHPFRLSLSKGLHGLCSGFDGLSPNGGSGTHGFNGRWKAGGHGVAAVLDGQSQRQNLACSPTVTVRSAPGVTHTRLYELM